MKTARHESSSTSLTCRLCFDQKIEYQILAVTAVTIITGSRCVSRPTITEALWELRLSSKLPFHALAKVVNCLSCFTLHPKPETYVLEGLSPTVSDLKCQVPSVTLSLAVPEVLSPLTCSCQRIPSVGSSKLGQLLSISQLVQRVR